LPSVSIFKPTVVRNKVPTKAGVWWMAWRCPETGKQFRVSTGAREKSVARQIAREKERRLLLDPFGLEPQLTPNRSWTEFVKEFLQHIKAKNRPGTECTYAISLNHLTGYAKPVLLRDVSPAVLQNFVRHRSDSKAKPATVNKDLRSIRSALKWADQRGYIPCPSFKGLFVREDVKAPVVIPSEHVAAMLTALGSPTIDLKVRPSSWWKVFLSIIYGLGLRRSEALGLKWNVLDFDSKWITILSETSKGRKDRQLPVGEKLINVLQEWYTCHTPRPQPTDKILPWEKQSLRQLYLDWKAISKAAGFPDGIRYVPKNYRSTCGSELIQNGTPSMVVKDFLGHSTVTTTEKFYVNTSQSLRAAVDRREHMK
jgi:integrase/recombinase XerC